MFFRARAVPMIGMGVLLLVAFAGARFASENAQAGAVLSGTVYWSDGDSGRLSDGTQFRLHGIDAPETGPVNRRGGAACEAERELGFEAKVAATELTRGHNVVVTQIAGRDRYGRNLVRLSLEGQDVGTLLLAQGTHQRWDYDSGSAKPDWCDEIAIKDADRPAG